MDVGILVGCGFFTVMEIKLVSPVNLADLLIDDHLLAFRQKFIRQICMMVLFFLLFTASVDFIVHRFSEKEGGLLKVMAS